MFTMHSFGYTEDVFTITKKFMAMKAVFTFRVIHPEYTDIKLEKVTIGDGRLASVPVPANLVSSILPDVKSEAIECYTRHLQALFENNVAIA